MNMNVVNVRRATPTWVVVIAGLALGCSDTISPRVRSQSDGARALLTSVPSSTLLAESNFEDSTFGPFGHSRDVDIVNDPTNSGHGKVVRIHYRGTAQDCNRYLHFYHPLRLGDTLYFRGDFFIAAGATSRRLARTLIEGQSAKWNNPPEFWSVVGSFGTGWWNDNTYVSAKGRGDYANNPIFHMGTFTIGVWHRLETEVSLGTSLGASDGVFKMWVDGVLIEDEPHKKWTDAAWSVSPNQVTMSDFYVGEAADGSAQRVTFDEYRYWDNISFSTQRAGSAPVVTSVAVAVDSSNIGVGHTGFATIIARDQYNNVMTAPVTSWESANPNVATIDGTGRFTALGAGVTTLTATVAGVVGTSPKVTVTAPPSVANVQVVFSPPSPLMVGMSTQATATLRDSSGNAISGPVTWTSTNATVATISSAGRVTAIAAGTSTIVAEAANGVKGTTSVTVAAPVSSVSVALSAPSPISVGSQTQATATLRDSARNSLEGTVTWVSANPSVASISSTGLVSGVAAGTTAITATAANGVKGSANITVVGVVTTVSIALKPVSPINVGAQTQAIASLSDAAGNSVMGTAAWSSTNPAIATVSSAGLVTGMAAGTTTIIATANNGVSGRVSLTVSTPTTSISGAILASSGFEDGTLGPYNTFFPADVSVVNDPTNSGHGKVVQIHFAGTNQDRNRSIHFTHPVHLGDTLYFRGDFYIPGNANPNSRQIQRKLLYWQSAKWSNPPEFWSVVSSFGTGWWNDNTYVGVNGADYTNNPIFHKGTFTFGTWHRVETEVSLGTSLGASDGVFKMWVDGVLIEDESHKKWTDAAWAIDPSLVMLTDFYIGDQEDSTISGVSYDEYRYWDNVSFSTERLP